MAAGAVSVPFVRWLALLAIEAALLMTTHVYDASSGATPFGSFLYGLVLFATSAGTVGLLLAIRRPENIVGRLLSIGPIVMVGGFLGYGLGAYRGLTAGPTDALGGASSALAAAITMPGILLTIPAVAIAFPDGRLPGRRWRAPIRAIVAAVLAESTVSLVSPVAPGSTMPANPFAIPGLPAVLTDAANAIGTLALIASLAISVAAVAVRFRRSRGVERQQLKWFLASVAATGVLLPLSFLTDAGPAEAIDLASLLAASLLPVAIGIAITRYRLYEIDRIISRTLSYAIVTGLLAAVFAVLVIGLQTALAAATGAGGTLAVAASTLAVFALFQPLRRRVQHLVDRRFNRSQVDSETAMTELVGQLRDETDLERVAGRVELAVQRALAPAHTTIWTRSR
jgi:hypothetical protein